MGKIRQVYSLKEGEGEVIEADAVETSQIVNKKVSDLKIPEGVQLGAILKKNNSEVVIAKNDVTIESGDRIVLFTLSKMIKKAEKLLSVRFGF